MSATKSGQSTDIQKFGRFQIVQILLICLPIAMVSMMNVNFIFVAEDVNHRCRIPECDDAISKVDVPDYWPKDIDARCYKPVLNQESYHIANDTCSNETFTANIEVCSDWIYEHNNSIMSELNLGCQSWKSTLVGSVHNAGMMFSMSIAGWIADKFGRKPALIICSVSGIVGVIKIFLTNYYGFLCVEFFESLLASGLYTVAVVLLIEVGGDSKRVATGVIFSYAIYFGEVCFAVAAMYLKYWKYVAALIYTPVIIFIIYLLILKESMRWQIINKKISEVKETLKIVTRVNEINITEKEINEISGEELVKRFNAVSQKETENIKDILSSMEMIKRLSITSFCFFTSSFVYYGLAVHSVHLPGDKYTNFFLSSVTSFPSDLLALYSLNKFGRKMTLQCSYLFLGVFLLASSFSPQNLSWLVVVLFLFGKLGTVICFTSIFTYGLELFPTSVRGTLFGICNTTARIGSMLAPITLLLISEYKALPSILFSCTAVLSAFLLIFTPETKTLPMFDTIAQIESYKKKLNQESHRSGSDIKPHLETSKNIKV